MSPIETVADAEARATPPPAARGATAGGASALAVSFAGRGSPWWLPSAGGADSGGGSRIGLGGGAVVSVSGAVVPVSWAAEKAGVATIAASTSTAIASPLAPTCLSSYAATRLRWVRISLMIRSRRGSVEESTWVIAAAIAGWTAAIRSCIAWATAR